MERIPVNVAINTYLHPNRCMDLDRWAVNLILEENMLDTVLEYKLLPLLQL